MTALKKGDIKATECIALSFEGKGICHIEGETVFVDSMYPGDEGQIEIQYRRAGSWFAKLRSLSALSKARVKPRCPVSTACGGCVYQAYSYEAEKRAKERLIIEQFRRNGLPDVEMRPIIGMDNPFGYRNKVVVPFGKGRRGELIFGFYQERTHRIVERQSCSINDPLIESLLPKLNAFLSSEGIEPYDELTRTGSLRHALIRTTAATREMMLVLVSKNNFFAAKTDSINRLKDACPEINSCYLNINPVPTNVVLGDRYIHLFGESNIHEVLGGLSFVISPGSFFQVNSKMAETLYATAIDLAGLTPNDVVFDAYSGTGSIGLFAAKEAKYVKAVELVPSAVEDARINALTNGITNYVAHAGDATEEMIRMAEANENTDCLFVDPPRKGCGMKFLEAAAKLNPRTIVYISCNPVSLATDLKTLIDKYVVKVVQPIDMFPRTRHVETVVALSLKK